MASKLRSGKRFRRDGHHLSALSRFWLTPQEVQEHILLLACRSPEETHEGDLTSRSLIALDVKTTLSLLLTSRALNGLVMPILYANICIVRPSILVDLLRTLRAKPSLGKLVKSLQLGPTTHLPQHWWPMTYLYGPDEVFAARSFATSLQDQALLPRWCCPLRRWPLTSIQESFSYRDLCLKNAIDGAQIHINVRLREPRQSWDREELDSDEWLVRVMMAQAAVELYLLEMRRLEDKSGYEVEDWEGEEGALHGPQPVKGEMVYYGSMRVLHWDSSPHPNYGSGTGPQNLLKYYWNVSWAAVEKHLARRGGMTDYFDHPLIFARSGMQLLAFEDDRRALISDAFIARARALYDDNSVRAEELPDEADDPTTIEGLLALSRSLLALTPRVQHLYLSGALQLLVCGKKRKELPLSSLRTLCLGPLTPYRDDSLAPTLQGEDLAQVERLRLSGCLVAEQKAEAIVALTSLTEVSWDLSYSIDGYSQILETIEVLQQKMDNLAEETHDVRSPDGGPAHVRTTASTSRLQAAHSADESELPNRHKRRLVDVSLIWQCVDMLLNSVTGAEARAAWSQGLSLCRGPHRLFLTMSDVCGPDFPEPRCDAASEETRALYRDSKEWWERCALGLPQRASTRQYG